MRAAHFQADITPPVGHPLCAGWYPSCESVADPLSAHGVIILSEKQDPVVLCALDWAELSNGEHQLWRTRLAEACGTSPDRVTVHCVHAHDAPWPDRDAQAILDDHQLPAIIMQLPWCDLVLNQVADAARKALSRATEVTHIQAGMAKVEKVASNRRIIGPDGKSRGVRWTRCQDAVLRAEPEGLIDPHLKTISLFHGTKKLFSLHYYAVHPTSYDATGIVTGDFPCLARNQLSEREKVPHLYFTECAGNVTPGKYNDGETDNRKLFTLRILRAMEAAQENVKTVPANDFVWKTQDIHLPPRSDQTEAKLLETIRHPEHATQAVLSQAALILAYQRRCAARIPITVGALWFGQDIVIAHLPGEAFIEYQLAAQACAPGVFTAVPAYGDCGPGYITLARTFAEGGYEPKDSFCSGESEEILKNAIHEVVGR